MNVMSIDGFSVECKERDVLKLSFQSVNSALPLFYTVASAILSYHSVKFKVSAVFLIIGF